MLIHADISAGQVVASEFLKWTNSAMYAWYAYPIHFYFLLPWKKRKTEEQTDA